VIQCLKAVCWACAWRFSVLMDFVVAASHQRETASADASLLLCVGKPPPSGVPSRLEVLHRHVLAIGRWLQHRTGSEHDLVVVAFFAMRYPVDLSAIAVWEVAASKGHRMAVACLCGRIMTLSSFLNPLEGAQLRLPPGSHEMARFEQRAHKTPGS
jgi:hypothetical protein